MADVRTYDVGGSFIKDIGKTILPASIKPFDFSALDKAMEVESEIGNKAVEVAMQNVKDMGKIKDELTQLTSPSLYHAAELEAAKQSVGLDDKAFAQAANSIDDPMAMFEVDRKMKKLSADPRVKELMYDNAVLEATKMQLPTIVDPGMRAIAIKDINDATQSADPNAIKNLNMSQYQSVDLETLYLKALDQFAPYIPTQEEVVGDDGRTHIRTVNKRDPEMVAKTRKYFQDNKVVKNNLLAKGYVDDKGNPVAPEGGTSWYDDLEAPQLVPIESISEVRGATGKSGSDSSTGDSSYTPSEGLTAINTEPEIYEDEDSGNSFDVSVIAEVETGGRSPNSLVHVDPGTQKDKSKVGINVGAYSFNKGTATAFIKALPEMLEGSIDTNPAAASALAELQALKFSGPESIKEKNVAAVKSAYERLDKALGGDLKKMEDRYAVEEFGNKSIDYMKGLKGMEDAEFSVGDSTLMMDTAIQFGVATWQQFFKNYAAHARDGGELSLKEFITKERNAWYNKNYSAAEAQAYKDRAYKVYYAANQLDNGEDRTGGSTASAEGGQADQKPAFADPSTYGWNMQDNVQMAADSIAGEKRGWGLQ